MLVVHDRPSEKIESCKRPFHDLSLGLHSEALGALLSVGHLESELLLLNGPAEGASVGLVDPNFAKPGHQRAQPIQQAHPSGAIVHIGCVNSGFPYPAPGVDQDLPLASARAAPHYLFVAVNTAMLENHRGEFNALGVSDAQAGRTLPVDVKTLQHVQCHVEAHRCASICQNNTTPPFSRETGCRGYATARRSASATGWHRRHLEDQVLFFFASPKKVL